MYSDAHFHFPIAGKLAAAGNNRLMTSDDDAGLSTPIAPAFREDAWECACARRRVFQRDFKSDSSDAKKLYHRHRVVTVLVCFGGPGAVHRHEAGMRCAIFFFLAVHFKLTDMPSLCGVEKASPRVNQQGTKTSRKCSHKYP